MGISIWDGVRLSTNDGVSFRCCDYHCVEWRWDSVKCHCAFLKTQYKFLSTRCKLWNFSCLFIPPHLFNCTCHSWYHVCQLLFFKKEVQIYMAFGFTGSNSTTFCYSLLLANDINATFCRTMLNDWGRTPGYDVISLGYMLVGLASISCGCNLTFRIYICLYFINRSFSPFWAQNDHK